MKLANKNVVREKYTKMFLDFLKEQGEDVGQIGSNVVNFPIVENDEEGWVEVVIKVPKDLEDEGYDKRVSYDIHLKEKEEKAKAKKEAKAKKMAYDEKVRQQKAKEKAEREMGGE